MMKCKYFLIGLVLMVTNSGVALTKDYPDFKPIRGAENIDEWRGTFEVTKCHSCPDFERPNGTNLKNLKRFGLDFAIIPKGELPECASTDIAMAHFFEITSDDNQKTSWLSKQYGLCDWSIGKQLQTLDLGKTFFTYRQQTSTFANKITNYEIFEIQRQDNGEYLVRRIVELSAETSEYPKRSVYIFEAKKVD